MADIELVIKIPEGLKNDFVFEYWTALSCMAMKTALERAIQLPKGHGRLIDVDAITKDFNTFQDSFVVNFEPISGFKGIVCKAPIIIKADEAEIKTESEVNK